MFDNEAYEGIELNNTIIKPVVLEGEVQFGCFAGKFLPNGSLIMTCPLIIVDGTELSENAAGSDLERYLFLASLPDEDPIYAVVLGNGSLINHSSSQNNVTYEIDPDNRVCKFYALRDIQIGQELFHDYGYDV